MATRKRPPRPPLAERVDARHDDLQALVRGLVYIIGCRVQRDAEQGDGTDVEAERLIETTREAVEQLWRRRREALPKENVLALAEELAEVYRNAPHAKSGPEWSAYVRHVARVVRMLARPTKAKLRAWALSKPEVARARGPVEAGRRAVADLLGIGESTLRLWGKTVKPAQSLGAPAPCFFGTTVAYEDALADVIELFGVAPRKTRTAMRALRAEGAKWDLMLDQPSRGSVRPRKRRSTP